MVQYIRTPEKEHFMKHIFVLNPVAGDCSVETQLLPAIKRAVAKRNLDAVIYLTKGKGDAESADGVYTNTSTKRGTAQKDMIQTLTTFQDKGVVVKEYKTFIEKHYDNFKNKNGYIPEMFNPYNESEIKEVAPTQSTQCGSSTSSATVLRYDGLRIRKLTPKECWRLMGFDDEDFEKASKVNSNTQLYKQAGNSIVVNVLEAIFDNLLQEYK